MSRCPVFASPQCGRITQAPYARRDITHGAPPDSVAEGNACGSGASRWACPSRRMISPCGNARVLIRYHFDDESAQIWQSEALETSRHDPLVQQPWQVCGGTTWAGCILRRVAPAQVKAGASSCEAWQSCQRPERVPHAVSCGYDLYRSSSSCRPEEPGHDAA